MKKLVSIFICAALTLLCASCVQKADEELMKSVTEDDFSISINVPKTEIKVGETITVTSEYKNISDKKIMICNIDGQSDVRVFKSGEQAEFVYNAVWQGGYMEPGETITKSCEFTPKKVGEYYAKANGCASVILRGDINGNGGSGDDVNNVNVYSEEIKITVTE